jgi:hypothetical protein
MTSSTTSQCQMLNEPMATPRSRFGRARGARVTLP